MVALAACGAPGAPGAGQGGQSVALDKKVASIELWGSPTDDGRKDQVTAWNAKYPNLKLTFGTQHNTTTQGEASFAPIIAAAAAGVPPTVVDFDRFQVAALALKRLWMPLDDFIKRDKYDMNRFAPLVVPEAKGVDGKWYAMIRSADDRLLYWNKELFQEVGLDPEKPPTTWDELKQFALRLNKRGAGAGGFDRVGFHTEFGQSHYHIFGWQNGGSFQAADGKKATLPDGKNQEALQWMTDFMKDAGGWGPLEDFRKSWGTNAQDAFLANQVAMVYQTNGSTPGNVARFRPDMNFGVAAPPVKKAGDKPLTWSGGHSYCISTGAKDADVGWELCKWLIGEEGITALYDGNLARARATGGAYVPPMTGQPELDKSMFAKYKTGNAAVDKVPDFAVSLMQYSRVREPSIASQALWDGVKASQTQAISQAKSAKQALDDNQILVQTALDQAWGSAPK
ncbi:MAG: extracellular solute-binding protein [Chloroflexota bacterium]|nr:extracellular solute-binding protein [Chloroflexota bacterium]